MVSFVLNQTMADYGGKPFISTVEECPNCGTVNVITMSEFVEEDFVCSHCGWYEELYFDEYVKERQILTEGI